MGRFDTTRWSVVLGAVAGDPADRDRFCVLYEPVIRAYLGARWRVPHQNQEVSDGVQEVFVECFKDRGALGRLDPGRSGGFRAFLYGVTRATAIAIERKSSRRTRDKTLHGSDLRFVQRTQATLSQAFDKAWARMIGREAGRLVAERAKKHRGGIEKVKCLELRFVRGLPPRDIAVEMECPVERVYELLKLAKLEYRSALLEVVGSYSPTASEKELEDKCRELAAHL